MPTPHNEAKKGEIAKVVLMPGDPNRASWIADNFLHDVKCVNTVRGNYCYTGFTKNGKRISVMSSGMGHPSIGIYSYELYSEYDVETIIRVGTCGSYQPEINLRDVLLCAGSSTDSNYAAQFHLNGTYSALADFEVLMTAKDVCEKLGHPYHMGNIFSADVFYDFDKETWKRWASLICSLVKPEKRPVTLSLTRRTRSSPLPRTVLRKPNVSFTYRTLQTLRTWRSSTVSSQHLRLIT